jgi:hydrogenase maturation protein HypF
MRQMALKGTNSPHTSSMGRLFDAVSSLVRLRDITNYEGQAAVELEQIGNGKLVRAGAISRRVVADLIDEFLLGTARI